MTQEFDPVGAVEAIERISNQVSVMAFDNGSCLHPCEPGPAAARAFIAAHPGKDLYFVVADLNDPLILGKPRKSDMFGSRVVWVDLDPPKKVEPAGLELWRSEKLNELDRSGLPQAHIIICSGRGLWCFWHLSRQVDPAEAEAINRALAQRLEGDKCHNIDRVARVPFTRNSKTGDIASVLREIEGEIAPEALPHTAPASAPAPIAASKIEVGEPLTSLDDLGQWDVDPRIRRIIECGRDPDNPKSGDDSRSAWLWDGVLGLSHLTKSHRLDRLRSWPERTKGVGHDYFNKNLTPLVSPDRETPRHPADPSRGQWDSEQGILDLNLRGRRQTKKYRPTLPIARQGRCLFDETKGFIVKTGSARRGFYTMVQELGLPGDRESGMKLIRRSMADLIRARLVAVGRSEDELSMFLGHRKIDSVSELYAPFNPGYLNNVSRVIEEIAAEIEADCQGAFSPQEHRTQ